MLRIAICDDEKLFRENIKKTSEKIVIKKVDLYKLVLDVLLLNEECYDELL